MSNEERREQHAQKINAFTDMILRFTRDSGSHAGIILPACVEFIRGSCEHIIKLGDNYDFIDEIISNLRRISDSLEEKNKRSIN
jgi:hypothetical protein